MRFYWSLIAGGKALFLSSSPAVATLSLPHSPPPPSPPSLADHDLCPPAACICPVQQGQHCFSRSQCLSTRSIIFDNMGGTHGAPAGQGFDLWPQHPSTLLISWQWGLESRLALHDATKKRVAFSLSAPCRLLPFQRHVEVHIVSNWKKMGHVNNDPR